MPSLETAKQQAAEPKGLKPFRFHGVDLEWQPGQSHAKGDCPFCSAEGKLSVDAGSSQWQCWVCAAKGNALTFLRQLWELSDKATKDYAELDKDRGFLDPMTLVQWRVVRSAITGDWLVPGFDAEGKLCQLYRYGKVLEKGVWRRRLLATAEMGHGLFGVNLFDPTKPEALICEGPWDGMMLWETLRACKRTEDGLALTGAEASSLLASANVLAVPGANVWQESWTKLLKGKRVALLYDNDHPRRHPRTNQLIESVGYSGMKRAAQAMAASRDRPESITFLRWGAEGQSHEPTLPSGHDVRDYLRAGADSMQYRVLNLRSLIDHLVPIPDDWVPGRTKAAAKSGSVGVDPLPCKSWQEVLNAWRKALHWRTDLETALACMMAVAASTSQQDDQLFLQVIADAGSAKTRLCDAMLTSKNCFSLEHITSFHSGWKDASGEDFSILSRINHKTLITPEGDVLMSSPHFAVVMSQMRRIFDGSSGATYGNSKEDKKYPGLRTPWIIVGTPALMDSDQSRLGDRHLRVCIGQASDDEVEDICMRAGHSAMRSVKESSNGDMTGHLSAEMLEAYRLTGGYIDHLRANASELLSMLTHDDDLVVRRCYKLAAVAASLRARPNPNAADHKEKHDTVELPSRLTKQFSRLASCLAVVLQRPGIDERVLGIVKKVALDTAKGRTLEVCRRLLHPPALAGVAQSWEGGLSLPALAILTGQTDDAEKKMLLFLSRIRVVEAFTQKAGLSKRHRWRLTKRFHNLFSEVMQDAATA